MKKVLTLVLAVGLTASLVSCKKDYTCTCTIPSQDNVVIPINDSSKGDAEEACDAASATYALVGGSCNLD